MFPIKWLVTCEFSYKLYFGILFETFNYLLSKGGGGGVHLNRLQLLCVYTRTPRISFQKMNNFK